MKPLNKKIEGATLSKSELRELIPKRLNGKLSKKWCLHTADFNYYLPRYEEAKKIINASKMKQFATTGDAKVRGERFDCDDVSLILKARFTYAAYRDASNYQNYPYCFGIAWGLLPFPFPHSLNWMITDDKQLYFVEPRREQILPLDKCKGFRFINLMLV